MDDGRDGMSGDGDFQPPQGGATEGGATQGGATQGGATQGGYTPPADGGWSQGGYTPPADGAWSQGGYTSPSGGSGQDGYYVPPPTGSGDVSYPGGQGWQGLSAGEGGAPGGPLPPPPPKRRIGFSALRLVVVVAIVFGGGIWAFFTAADRDGDGAITKAGDLDVLALQVGDCFDDPGDVEEVSSIRAIPCDQPHDNEVFHEFELPQGAGLPSREAIDEQIGTRCIPAFDEFVGIAYEDSELDLFTFEPTAGSWQQGDRTITCAVYDLSGDKLVGTARGAAR